MPPPQPNRLLNLLLALICFLSLSSCSRSRPVTSSDQLAPTETPPAATAAPVPTPPKSTRRERFETLPESGPPKIGFTIGAEHVAPDGQRVRFKLGYPQAGISQIARFEGGWVIADDRFFEGTYGLHRFSTDGQKLSSACGSAQLLVDARAGRRAYQIHGPLCDADGPSGPPATVALGTTAGGGGEQHVTLADRRRLIDLLGDRLLLRDWKQDRDYLRAPDGTLMPVPGLARVHAVAPDSRHVAGSNREETCQTVLISLVTDRRIWRRDGICALSFSPNSRELLTLSDDGNTFVILNRRTGSELRRFSAPRGLGWVSTPQWETNHSLLAVLHQGRSAAIVRWDVDGTLSRTTPLRRSRSNSEMSIETVD